MSTVDSCTRPNYSLWSRLVTGDGTKQVTWVNFLEADRGSRILYVRRFVRVALIVVSFWLMWLLDWIGVAAWRGARETAPVPPPAETGQTSVECDFTDTEMGHIDTFMGQVSQQTRMMTIASPEKVRSPDSQPQRRPRRERAQSLLSLDPGPPNFL